ncbi:MAG: ion transporter [Planctomycetota bacterium]|nr:ion transporter [Planctomycetota bacterium]
MPEERSNDRILDTTTYDVFISVCGIGAIAIVGWLFFADPDTEQAKLLNYFDDIFCLIFFLDYLRQLLKAPRKLRYILGWGLFDLASSIPAVGPLRLLRLARVVRVLRALRSFRILAQVFRSDRVGAAIVSSMTMTLLGIILACMGVLHYEGMAADANIKTADDVMWWAVVTTSTVGYGDFYPVTGPGRLLAAVVMVLGIGLFATLAAAIASRMTSIASLKHPGSIEHKIHELQQQNRELLRKLESKL